MSVEPSSAHHNFSAPNAVSRSPNRRSLISLVKNCFIRPHHFVDLLADRISPDAVLIVTDYLSGDIVSHFITHSRIALHILKKLNTELQTDQQALPKENRWVLAHPIRHIQRILTEHRIRQIPAEQLAQRIRAFFDSIRIDISLLSVEDIQEARTRLLPVHGNALEIQENPPKRCKSEADQKEETAKQSVPTPAPPLAQVLDHPFFTALCCLRADPKISQIFNKNVERLHLWYRWYTFFHSKNPSRFFPFYQDGGLGNPGSLIVPLSSAVTTIFERLVSRTHIPIPLISVPSSISLRKLRIYIHIEDNGDNVVLDFQYTCKLKNLDPDTLNNCLIDLPAPINRRLTMLFLTSDRVATLPRSMARKFLKIENPEKIYSYP